MVAKHVEEARGFENVKRVEKEGVAAIAGAGAGKGKRERDSRRHRGIRGTNEIGILMCFARS